MHDKTAAQSCQNFRQFMSFFWNNATGKEAGFLEGKRIKRIPCCLKGFDSCKLSMNVHVAAVKNDFWLVDFFQDNFYWFFPIKKNRYIQYGSAFFVAVRRGIAPTTAPVYPKGKFYGMFVCDDMGIFVVSQILDGGFQHF